MKNILIGLAVVLVVSLGAYLANSKRISFASMQPQNGSNSSGSVMSGSLDKTKLKSDEEWRKILTPGQFHILREAGTEAPFTGSLLHNDKKGTYYSYGCKEALFRSETKYDSGTGWPSFTSAIPGATVIKIDPDGQRMEVLDRCGGHLGHVFDDGPAPTGRRYCMNSEALYFVEDKTK